MEWVYTVLFAAIGIVWWFVVLRLGRPHVTMGEAAERPQLIRFLLLIAWGAAGLELTLLGQGHVQQAYANLTGLTFERVTAGALVLAFGVVVISGLYQELLKGLPVWVFRNPAGWIQRAAAVGFGFGVWEAIRLAAMPLSEAPGFAWISVLERFSAIGFHVASPVLMATYVLQSRALTGYFVASVLHGLMNYAAVFYSFWLIDVYWVEALVLAMSIASVAFTIWRVRLVTRADR